MKKYLILVKHSVPQIEVGQPANTWKLSEEGRLRAQLLAKDLEAYAPEIMISSDEPKAKETAEILACHLQVGIQVVPDLREHDRSNVAFLSPDSFQTSIREFFQRPSALVFGKETADETYTRFYQAVHAILNEHRNRTVVIVTHGTVISLFVSRLTGSSDFELWKMMGLPSFIAVELGSNTVIVKSKIV